MILHAFILLLSAILAPQNALQASDVMATPAVRNTAASTIASDVPPAAQEAKPLKQSRNYRKGVPGKARAQMFIGIVEWEYKPLAWECDVPNCDHFALYDTTNLKNYEFDDARVALPYEGKTVKVSAVVNLKDDSLHVISIEELKK